MLLRLLCYSSSSMIALSSTLSQRLPLVPIIFILFVHVCLIYSAISSSMLSLYMTILGSLAFSATTVTTIWSSSSALLSKDVLLTALLSITAVFHTLITRYFWGSEVHDLYFHAIAFPLILTGFGLITYFYNWPLHSSISILSFFVALFVALVAFMPSSFYFHMVRTTLKDFPHVVDYPNVYVHTPLDVKLRSLDSPRLYVLLGPTGIGKSVALYEHLKDQKVLWLSARLSLAANAEKLGFTGGDDDRILFNIFKLLKTGLFTLVIDDAEVIPLSHPISSLYTSYGAFSPPYPIFLTLSDAYVYYQNIYKSIYRTAWRVSVSFPSPDVMQRVCDAFKVYNCTEVLQFTGPSLRDFNLYLTNKPELYEKCEDIVGVISQTMDVFSVMQEFTSIVLSDYQVVDLSRHNISDSKFEQLVSLNLLGSTYAAAYFHSPLVRRASCSQFRDRSFATCNVTLCPPL
ncbi:hypothetical protein RCL1_001317 [Eukaryota sp. TZLM3-RCL]